MSQTIELSDSQRARQYLLETWALSRAEGLMHARLRAALRVALELVSEGQPVVPIGFISDVIVYMSGAQTGQASEGNEAWTAAIPDASMARRYDDYVLGKFVVDMTLERAADELQKYKDRNRDRVLGFAIQQMQLRAGLPCVQIGPAPIKALLGLDKNTLQREFDQALSAGFSSSVMQQWDELIQSVRNSGELLGTEDIFEIASGTALSKFGQRLALRQVMQACQHLVVGLPKQKPSGIRRHHAVATNILEEDLYPVGGFSSIANRGTMESLLRSELAYMETDERPDLFDIKYARDELLYYSRDENQFFRRRITIMWVLDGSLVSTRVKDPGASWQRIVLTLACLVASVQALTDWLSSDALKFEVIFPADATGLQQERQLLELIFQEDIRAGRMHVSAMEADQLRIRSEENARQSLCHRVHVHARPAQLATTAAEMQRTPTSVWQPLVQEFCVAEALPILECDEQRFSFEEADNPWRAALQRLLHGLG